MNFLQRDYAREILLVLESEDPAALEFIVRAFAFAVPVAIGHLFTDIQFLLSWYLVLLATIALTQVLRLFLRHKRSFLPYAILIGGIGMQASVVAYLAYLLWQIDDPACHFFGALLLMGGMIHISVIRSGLLPLLAAVLLPFIVVMGIICYHVAMGDVFLGLIGVFGLGSLTLYGFVAMRRRDDSRRTRDAIRDELLATQRSGTIAGYVGGIAHDFNNSLTVMMGNLDLAEQVTDARERQHLLQEARAAASRGADLVESLLQYAGKTPGRVETKDVGALIEMLLRTLRRIVPERITLRSSLPDVPMQTKLDPSQLDSALLNLIINSTHAIEDGGVIDISVKRGADPDLPVLISVSDNGRGIPASEIPRITEPFYTTKPIGEGTGLGLSSVQRFVSQIGGELRIQSELGLGTTVTLALPDAIASQIAPQPKPEPERRTVAVQ